MTNLFDNLPIAPGAHGDREQQTSLPDESSSTYDEQISAVRAAEREQIDQAERSSNGWPDGVTSEKDYDAWFNSLPYEDQLSMVRRDLGPEYPEGL